MNADRKVAEDVGFYYREAHLGEAGDWPGADLVADWFRRNIRRDPMLRLRTLAELVK
jgi:hypothetical protein